MSDLTFSQRMGIKPVKEIQINFVDKQLRTESWNFIYKRIYTDAREYNRKLKKYIWEKCLILPIDEQPYNDSRYNVTVKSYLLNCNWDEFYGFIEIFLEYSKGLKWLIDDYNDLLEKNNSGYRYIGCEITPISDKSEGKEIQEALNISKGRFSGVNTHLSTALTHLSNRENPDYRNSIKESISAVESISQKICGDDSATLGKALNKIESKTGVELHSALKEGYKKIYGYTADGDGIRHALLEKDSLSFEDAKYMLVSCSAFINYLIVKADKAGIFSNTQ